MKFKIEKLCKSCCNTFVTDNNSRIFCNQKCYFAYPRVPKEIKIIDTSSVIIDTANKAYSLGFIWGDGTIKIHNNKHFAPIYYTSFEIIKDDFDQIINYFSDWGEWSKSYREKH